MNEFANALQEVTKKIVSCEVCFRSMERSENKPFRCALCENKKRDQHRIAIVEKESDLHAMEKTGAYQGLYHLLGGVVDPLDSESPRKIHLKNLYERVKNLLETHEYIEVILATNPTTEGDTTALYIERVLEPLGKNSKKLKITRLGRGLSLGSELEYADEMTVKNAFLNRK